MAIYVGDVVLVVFHNTRVCNKLRAGLGTASTTTAHPIERLLIIIGGLLAIVVSLTWF